MQERSKETQERILQAAEHLFSQSGYEATGVAEICDAAGISKGAFYHHFSSKHTVFLKLLQNWLDSLEAQMQLDQAGMQKVPQMLLNMVETVTRAAEDAHDRLPLFLEFWTQASRDPLVWRATIEPYRRFRQYFESLVQAGIAEGSFEPVDAGNTARTIVALGAGLLLQSLLEPEQNPLTGANRESLLLLFKGLERRLV